MVVQILVFLGKFSSVLNSFDDDGMRCKNRNNKIINTIFVVINN